MTIDVPGVRERLAAVLGDSMRLGELLGTGGFAAVFEARDPFLERDVAIKVLDPSLGLTEDAEAQFLHEARAVAGVEHPHIVPLYAAESRGGLLFLVMRLLPGQSLADHLRSEGPLPFKDAARLAHEVAMALATAHQRGVVHRDIKPENILLDAAGHATVTDFGISRVISAPSREATGESAGTPQYMSPEHALGEAVDGRADVYSLGVVLFQMLTGVLPFQASNLTELLGRLMTQPAPSVASLRPDTPAGLTAAVERMLAKDRNARPDAPEAVRILEVARTPEGLLTPTQVRRKRWRRRMTLVSVAVVAGGTVLAGVGFLAFQAARIFLFSDQGAPPALSVAAPGVPDSIAAAARADGLLEPDEVVLYVFVPAGGTMADALLLTDSALIRRSPTNPRRIQVSAGALHLNRRASGGVINGTAVMAIRDQPPDTLYRGLSSLEVSTLLTAMQAAATPPGNPRSP